MTAAISLGSNLGDRLGFLKQGREFLRTLGSSDHFLVAPVYETEPIGCPPGTAAFLNSVIEIETEQPAAQLLEALLHFEESLGRPRLRDKNSPRPIDLDLLYCGNLILNEPALTLPHPRLHERRFVLQPLSEIRPGLVIPVLDRTVESLLASLGDRQAIRLYLKVW